MTNGVRLSPSSGMSGWTNITLLNGWVNIVGAQVAQYRIKGDEVSVRLAIQNGIATNIFLLPIGFRPPADVGVPTLMHDNTDAPDFGHLRIQSDGQVILEHPGSLNNHKVWATFTFSVLP